jgi:hypothetical protein
VGSKGFEGGGSIWLAVASGTTFAWAGFGLTSELELEADFGGFVAFDVEDRWDDTEDEDERCSFNFRYVKIHNSRDGRRKRTVLSDRGATGGSGTSSAGSTFSILCGRNESLTSFKKASASETSRGRVPVLACGAW